MTNRTGAPRRVDVLAFGARVMAVSALGVLAPRPLLAANMFYGAHRGALSGVRIAHGHALAELALIVAIAGGLLSIPSLLDEYADSIAVLGGLAMLGFAAVHISSFLNKKDLKLLSYTRAPFAVGVLMTALNQFFLG